MTEQQWLTNEDSATMLRYLIHLEVGEPFGLTSYERRDKSLISDRKLRLWAEAAGLCTICRSVGSNDAWSAQRWAEYVPQQLTQVSSPPLR